MSGEEKISIKIKKNMGITQALKKLVKDAGENVKNSVWNATLEKLVELNNQRKTDDKDSIFSGGTALNDWHHNFVVHEGNIDFSKSELEVLLDTMQVSENVKNKILETVTQAPEGGQAQAPEGGQAQAPEGGQAQAPVGGQAQAPEGGQAQAPVGGQAQAPEGGQAQAPEGGQAQGPEGGQAQAPEGEQAQAPEGGQAQAPEGGQKTPEEIEQAAQEKGYRATEHSGTFYDENTKTHYRWDDEAGGFKEMPNVKYIGKNGIYLDMDDKFYGTDDKLLNGEYTFANEDQTVITTVTLENGILTEKKVVTTNDDKSYKQETYDKGDKLVKTEEFNKDGKLTKTVTVEYAEDGSSVQTEKKDDTVTKVVKRNPDDKITEITEGNTVYTYTYKEDNSYTVTKKVNEKLSQITNYNSENQAVREQFYNEDEVLLSEKKYTYQTDSTRVADIEYYNSYYEFSKELQQKQGDDFYELSHIAQWSDGRYKVFIDMNMVLGSTYIGKHELTVETEEEAKALQEEFLSIRELYSEIASYDQNGKYRGTPEISDDRKTEIIDKLTEIISDENKPLEVRQAAAFTATRGSLSEEKLKDAIINTKNPALINRLRGSNLTTEQWEKLYNMALEPEFRKSPVYGDIYHMLLGEDFQNKAPDEVRFKSFNNLPRGWNKDSGSYDCIPRLSVSFLNEHWAEIKEDDKFYLLARSRDTMDKETFDTKFIPSIPNNPTKDQVDKIRGTMSTLPDDVKADYHLIESGDRFYNILMKKILDNPSIIKEMGNKKDWDEARQKEAINEYIKDFGEKIAKQMGIDDPSKIQPGQILDFSKVKWPQPNIFNWWFNY